MNNATKSPTAEVHACMPMPNFERMNFYYGQALGVDDFRAEQNYFIEKLRLQNRCFHGYGIVCGLEVGPLPPEDDCEGENQKRWQDMKQQVAGIDERIAELGRQIDSKPDDSIQLEIDRLEAKKEVLQRPMESRRDCYPDDDRVPAEVLVNCGWALDCMGRELIVRQPKAVDLWSLLPPEQLQRVKQKHGEEDGRFLVELSLCYCEQPTHSTRPVIRDACAAVSKCVYGRTLEAFRFRASLTPAEPDSRCGNCCEVCDDECVVLAHICWDPSRPITMEDIDWRSRRSVSLYQPTVITGVSWRHGAAYSPDQAKIVLGTQNKSDGIRVEFSKPVHAKTLQPGVVDLWRIQGGRGLSGVISHIEGDFVDKPVSGLVESFTYKDLSGETLNWGDRILIIVRCNFILDECCQPVDGEHIGGLVPQIESYQKNEYVCEGPPQPSCAAARHQPWTSGNNRPGSTFESWFFIKEMEKAS